jgi:MFS family permease
VKLALFTIYAAILSVLLPSRIAELDPVHKVAALAVIVMIGSVANAVAQPVVGALSDRTRTRFGRRLPWMVVGASVGGLAIGATSVAPSLVILGALWVLATLALHALEVPMDAYLVDAFPPDRRGRAAGVVGLALVTGTAAGALLAGHLVTRPAVASWILAAAVALAVALFAALVRDAPIGPVPQVRRRLGVALRAIAATAAAHPDFVKILIWRVGYSIAYGAVFAYLFYIFTDHIGLRTVEAAGLIGLATALGSVATAISVILGGWLSDRIRRRRLFILVGNGVIGVGDLLLLASPTVSAGLAAAALFGIGFGLSISCGRALASEVLPNPEGGAATGLGMLSTAANVGHAVAPAIGAAAIAVGGYSGVFVTSIVGAIGCSIAIVLLRTVR